MDDDYDELDDWIRSPFTFESGYEAPDDHSLWGSDDRFSDVDWDDLDIDLPFIELEIVAAEGLVRLREE